MRANPELDQLLYDRFAITTDDFVAALKAPPPRAALGHIGCTRELHRHRTGSPISAQHRSSHHCRRSTSGKYARPRMTRS